MGEDQNSLTASSSSSSSSSSAVVAAAALSSKRAKARWSILRQALLLSANKNNNTRACSHENKPNSNNGTTITTSNSTNEDEDEDDVTRYSIHKFPGFQMISRQVVVMKEQEGEGEEILIMAKNNHGTCEKDHDYHDIVRYEIPVPGFIHHYDKGQEKKEEGDVTNNNNGQRSTGEGEEAIVFYTLEPPTPLPSIRGQRYKKKMDIKKDLMSHVHYGVDNTGNTRVWDCSNVLAFLLVMRSQVEEETTKIEKVNEKEKISGTVIDKEEDDRDKESHGGSLLFSKYKKPMIGLDNILTLAKHRRRCKKQQQQQQQQQQQDQASTQNDGTSLLSNHKQRSKKPSETPEAAIARLTSSYSNAISAVAQLKKRSDSLMKSLQKSKSIASGVSFQNTCQKNTMKKRMDVHSSDADAYDGDVEDDTILVGVGNLLEESMESIQQCSKVARDTFENTLLSDPLIRKFCPTLEHVGVVVGGGGGGGGGYKNRWGNNNDNNQEEEEEEHVVTLTSAAHQSALKKLAYASLVNYADLLLSGCCCCCCCSRQRIASSHDDNEKCSILSRGVVPLLKILQCRQEIKGVALPTCMHMPQCLWKEQMMEEEEVTKRLALVSYCDACDLDGTDPTIWFKLACAARGLGMVLKKNKQREMETEMEIDDHDMTDSSLTTKDMHVDNCMMNLNFERLERYALECGLTALSSNQPPNRALSRAFHEFELERVSPDIATYNTETIDKFDSATLIMYLPRYNWATLGTSLLRACRDGVTSNLSHGCTVQKSWVSKKWHSIEMASPCVCITVSLLLTLPSKVLGKMCSFLQEDDVNRLESTCRSLSVDIVPACALLEKDHISIVRQMEQEMGDMLQKHEMTKNSTGEDTRNKSFAHNLAVASAGAHRSSQRVRTQLMESGKQAERDAKWKSVEYCLLSSFLPCTMDDPIYKSCLNQEIHWDSLAPLHEYATMIKSMISTNDNTEHDDVVEMSYSNRGAKNWAVQSALNEKSSMANFIDRWSGKNSGAREILNSFISHVSRFVDFIYDDEKENSLVLTQCFKECFDFIVTTSSGSRKVLRPQWYGKEEFHLMGSSECYEAIETLAINLLSSELKMKACEKHGMKVLHYDDDLHAIKTNLPLLIHLAENLTECHYDNESRFLVFKLLIRTYWLAGIFYVWWSRNSVEIEKVHETESIALDFLDKAIKVLESQSCGSIRAISTPHLKSPGRNGAHWSELSIPLLSQYRNNFKSSTVISRVRQKFSMFLHDIQQLEVNISTFPEDRLTELFSIEKDLSDRYGIHNGQPEHNLDELVSDFIVRHKRNLAKKSVQDPSIGGDSQNHRWGDMWDAIPSCDKIPFHRNTLKKDPSLLTIIAFTIQRNPEEYACNIVKILVRILISVLHKRAEKVEKVSVSDGLNLYENESSGEESDDDSESGCEDAGMLLRLAHFLMRKLQHIISVSAGNILNLKQHVLCIILAACEHASGILPKTPNRLSTGQLFNRLRPSHDILHVALSIASSLLQGIGSSREKAYKDCMTTIFVVLIRSIICCKNMMRFIMNAKDKNVLSRSECHPLIMLHVKYCALCAVEAASIMTQHGTNNANDIARGSFLIDMMLKKHSHDGDLEKDLSPMIQFAASLSWFWDFLSSANMTDTLYSVKYSSITNAVHKQAATKLVVPVASCICAFLGSCGHGPAGAAYNYFSVLTMKANDCGQKTISSSGYHSSDEYLDGEYGYATDQRIILHSLRKTVQCVGLVFSNQEDKEISILPSCKLVQVKQAYFLPLVVSRVLSKLADYVMKEFHEGDIGSEGESQGEGESERLTSVKAVALWSEQYPCSFRAAGAQLDLLLHRAYRCLHGINLSGPQLVSQLSKESIFPIPSSGNLDSSFYFLPESMDAAVKLYRCVRRSYFNCRKRVPAEVFKCILSVLPKESENVKVTAIKNFIFTPYKDSDFILKTEENPENITYVDDDFVSLPHDFPTWILKDTENIRNESDEALNEDLCHNPTKDVDLVRRGIWEYLANDPLPKLGSCSTHESIQYDGSDRSLFERKVATDTEIAVSKQLLAIINAIGNEPMDETNWYRAGLCISVKLNLILDRLIPAENTFKLEQFLPPRSMKRTGRAWQKGHGQTRDRKKLLKDQRLGFIRSLTRRSKVLSHDLSVYMEHQYCSATSLKMMQDYFVQSDTYQSLDSVSKELLNVTLSIFHRGELSLWQHEWGSFFVGALQAMRRRCFHVAMYLSKQKVNGVYDGIFSQVAETFGTALYDEIGFSARKQTNFEKRRKAVLAAKLFQCSLDSLRSSVAEDSNDCPATWESLFMIGKCYEKVANTLKEEAHLESEGERMYEHFMNQALESFNTARVEAKAFEDDGSSLDYQGGGSSHGLVEFTYRLHATRLKVLISSIKVGSDKLQPSLREASRIVEKYWFDEPTVPLEDKPLQDRLWIVFADVVKGLASCRKGSPFFHRSVYRHAQAFLWARFIHDPLVESVDDMESISPEKCSLIEGLESNFNYASAEAILNVLFDKKRPQLVAVWVTTPSSPTPFEAINNSNRKFDRLRLKYISAFIELTYCRRKHDQLNQLIKSIHSTPRDLPSFYDVSLGWDLNSLNNKQDCHAKDNLLLPSFGLTSFLKKFANAALCGIFVDDVKEKNTEDRDLIETFCELYSCFLRLNCPLDNAIWQSQHIRRQLEIGTILEADALCKAYQCIFMPDEDSTSIDTWERKMALLLKACKKGHEVYGSNETDTDLLKKCRKKRKIEP